MPQYDITERDKDVLLFIQSFIYEHQYSPSINEICKGVFLSKPVVRKHLLRLVEHGYLSITPKTARSIVVKIAI